MQLTPYFTLVPVGIILNYLKKKREICDGSQLLNLYDKLW